MRRARCWRSASRSRAPMPASFRCVRPARTRPATWCAPSTAPCWCSGEATRWKTTRTTDRDIIMSAGNAAHGAQRNTLEEEGEILDAIERWLDRDVRPHVLALEHADTYPEEMVEQMKALGLFAATIAEEYGGCRLLAAH